ncbi:MAG: deoxyguanosinetriphosphate triphosphohydrolase [Proteobacteria bacterium]|nr:deoxyguanosinetriphosphate triphosphohydrolase [Pseudomonadota bacterium]
MSYNIELFSEKIRENLHDREKKYLSKYACLSSESKGRTLFPIEYKREFRLCYQRDRDRIIHSKPFRRLKGKTQVFLFPIEDHYRTRLSHTLEVSQISRTIARALHLNEDLTEAIALGHDLGHTPFGHFGEKILNAIVPGGFHHAVQSERIARMMNLTIEVCEGIAKHSKGQGPILDDQVSRYSSTLEGQIVRVADIIAYVIHDLDDSTRAGLIKKEDIPQSIIKVLGNSLKEKITTMIADAVVNTFEKMEQDFGDCQQRIYMSSEVINAIDELRSFLFKNVYEQDRVISDFNKVSDLCSSLYSFFCNNPEKLMKQMGIDELYDDVNKVACDYLSGMTDNYILDCYKTIFLPRRWSSDEIIHFR